MPVKAKQPTPEMISSVFSTLGKKGGPARAKALTAKRRKEIAANAAAKRWGNPVEFNREEDDFSLMANLYPKSTGLPFVVWIQERGGARHDVRVKVSPGPRAIPGRMISVGIRPDVHVIKRTGALHGLQLAQLKAWVEENRQVILDYWNGAIDTVEMAKRLKKI